MKTNVKKSLLSAAFIVAICSVCFAANAKTFINGTNTVAATDTGKMDKMSKMSKPMKKKKMTKMSKDKMKKDTSKMSKM